MQLLKTFEGYCGWLLFNFKNHDEKMLTNKAIFKDVSCSIAVECTESSVSSRLDQKHELLKDNRFPEIVWKVDEKALTEIKAFAVVVQDIDIPLPFAAVHGCLFNISNDKHTFDQNDIQALKENKLEVKYIKNILGNIYDGPRPLLNHGDHRYVYQIIGLKTPLDIQSESKFSEFENSLKDNIVAYGTWTGSYRRDL